ncbi:MAG TPA: hypothetical protein PK250_04970 [Syntrophobacter fumaroxidans]|nr:hypothetical protein [Syntrophobacter fumaroxidans]
MGGKRGVYLIAGSMALILFLAAGAMAAMTLPDQLKDVPLYPGSKIEQVMDVHGHSMATLKVQADRDAVFEFYKKNVAAGGWKIVFQMQQEDAAVIHFQKDKLMLQVTIQGKEDDGSVTYTMVTGGTS